MDKIVAFQVNLNAFFIKQLVFYLMDGAVNFEVDVHVVKLTIAMGLKPIAIKIFAVISQTQSPRSPIYIVLYYQMRKTEKSPD